MEDVMYFFFTWVLANTDYKMNVKYASYIDLVVRENKWHNWTLPYSQLATTMHAQTLTWEARVSLLMSLMASCSIACSRRNLTTRECIGNKNKERMT